MALRYPLLKCGITSQSGTTIEYVGISFAEAKIYIKNKIKSFCMKLYLHIEAF